MLFSDVFDEAHLWNVEKFKNDLTQTILSTITEIRGESSNKLVRMTHLESSIETSLKILMDTSLVKL